MLPGHALIFTFIHISHIQDENELGVEQNAEETEPTEDEDFEKMVNDVLVLPTPQEFQMPVSPFLLCNRLLPLKTHISIKSIQLDAQSGENEEGAGLFRRDVPESSFKEHQTLLSPPRELQDLVSYLS